MEGDERKLAVQNPSNLKHTIERHSELTSRYCHSFFLWCRKNNFNQRMCSVWTKEETFNSMRLAWPGPSKVLSYVILHDLLLRHRPVGFKRDIINFIRDLQSEVYNSTKIELFHRYFPRMATSDMFTKSLAAYKMKPKCLMNDLINKLVHLCKDY